MPACSYVPVPCHVARTGELPQDYLHIYVNVGDSGPDQVGLRGSLHTMLAREGFSNIFLFTVPCMKHQFHLAARGQLSLIDSVLRQMQKMYRYFTSVATTSHTWRLHLKKVRAAWVQLHGKGRDPKYTNERILFRVPPVAIAGRWASIDSRTVRQESFFLMSPERFRLLRPTMFETHSRRRRVLLGGWS